jgi:hypothetical protein
VRVWSHAHKHGLHVIGRARGNTANTPTHSTHGCRVLDFASTCCRCCCRCCCCWCCCRACRACSWLPSFFVQQVGISTQLSMWMLLSCMVRCTGVSLMRVWLVVPCTPAGAPLTTTDRHSRRAATPALPAGAVHGGGARCRRAERPRPAARHHQHRGVRRQRCAVRPHLPGLLHAQRRGVLDPAGAAPRAGRLGDGCAAGHRLPHLPRGRQDKRLQPGPQHGSVLGSRAVAYWLVVSVRACVRSCVRCVAHLLRRLKP